MVDPKPLFPGVPSTLLKGLGYRTESVQWGGALTFRRPTLTDSEDQDLEVVQEDLEHTYRALNRALNRANSPLPLLQEAAGEEHAAPPGPQVEGREGQN